ncbi:MAG: hypothetical protein AB8D52_10595 [Gammaproteobacteria bacterium]
MRKLFFLILICGGIWKINSHTSKVILGPGVMASEKPYQKEISPRVDHILGDSTIQELAEFRIKAKVLSKEEYRLGKEADFSPVDLALGWENMSDESVLEKITISQSGRFYRWHVDSFPIPRREIETQSANMHLIPVNDSVANKIMKVRQGDIIKMSGSLVNVISADGNWRWKSSQTRDDTGNGACELVWVKNFQIITPH